MSYIDNASKNAEDGLTYNSLSSGIYKNVGDPEKPITAEERAFFEQDNKIAHEKFIRQEEKNRHLDIARARILADGSTMIRYMALENGVVDQIGGIYEARNNLKGIIGEGMIICQ